MMQGKLTIEAAARVHRLRHIAGSRWSTRRYLNMQLLKEDRRAVA
jgi:hypothetical protein